MSSLLFATRRLNLQHRILLRNKLVTQVVIRATESFNLHCNNVARQIEGKCCPYYRTFNPRSVEFHQCHAKPHSICFFVFFNHIIKDNERNLCQDLLTIENTDSDLKVHALHYANDLHVRVRLSFQKLLQNRSTYRNTTKKCLGKE